MILGPILRAGRWGANAIRAGRLAVEFDGGTWKLRTASDGGERALAGQAVLPGIPLIGCRRHAVDPGGLASVLLLSVRKWD